jgi:hypothetical protein
MERLSKTQEILQNAAVSQPEEVPCRPCMAKKNTVWKISIPNNYFSNPEIAQQNFKAVGDVLTQYAKFSDPQVQSLFVSISILDVDDHLVYACNEQTAVSIFNELSKQGIYPKIEAALKKF